MQNDSLQYIRDFLARLRRRLEATAALEAAWGVCLALGPAVLLATLAAAILGEALGPWAGLALFVGAGVAAWSLYALWWRPRKAWGDEEDVARWVEARVPGLYSGVITSVQAGRALAAISHQASSEGRGDARDFGVARTGGLWRLTEHYVEAPGGSTRRKRGWIRVPQPMAGEKWRPKRGAAPDWPGFSPDLARATVERTARSLGRIDGPALVDRSRLRRLTRAGLAFGLVGVAALAWAPDTLDRGWSHLTEGAATTASAEGAEIEEVDVAVGDLSFRLDYPSYLDLQPRDIPRSGGDLSAVVGTEVRYTGSVLRPAKRVVLQLESDEDARWPVELTEEGLVRGAMRVGQTDRYRFLLTAPDGTLVRERRWRTVDARKDEKPQVRMLLPESDVEANPGDEVQLLFEAVDDHGLDEVKLVIDRGGGRGDAEVRTVARVDGERTARGSEVLAVDTLGLEPGDAVRVWFEARDLNIIEGPGYGLSAKRRIAMYSPDAEHEEHLLNLEELLGEMVDVLAGRLESPVDEGDPAELARYVSAQQKVSERNGRMLGSLDALVSSMEEDPLASEPLRRTLRGTLDGLRAQHEQESAQLRQAVVGQGITRRPEQLTLVLEAVNEEGVEELERGAWALKQELDRSREERLLAEGRELLEAQNDLMDLVERLKDGGDETLARDAERKLDDLLDNLRRMEREMGKLAERTPYENQNMPQDPSDREVDMKSVREQIEEVRQLIREGKLEEAMAKLEELNRQTQQMMAALQEDFGGTRRMNAEAREKMERFDDKLREVSDGQQGVRDETETLEEEMRERRRREMRERMEQAMESARDKARKIREELDGAGDEPLHPADEEKLEELRQKAAELEEAVERGDLEPAKEQAEEMSGECSGLGGEIGESEARELDMDRASRLRDAMERLGRGGELAEELASELDELQEAMNQPPAPNEREEAGRLKGHQEQLRERMGDLGEELERLEEMSPGAKEQLQPQLDEARRQMEEAGGQLGEGRPGQAGRHQDEALQQLRKAREAMEERRRQARDGEGPSDGPGVNDPRREVQIPEGDDYRSPKEFREEILKVMKERAPERYHEAIERYYEELVR